MGKKASGVKVEILYESDKDNVEQLISIYNEDRYKARVFFLAGRINYSFSRCVLYEYEDKSFEIIVFEVNFGINVNNRLYSSQRRVYTLYFKGGKFWFNTKNLHFPLTMKYFEIFMFKVNKNQYDNKCKVFNYLTSRFPWIRMLTECKEAIKIPFNTVYSKKLFGMNDLYRHIFKTPPKFIKKMLNSDLCEHYNDEQRIGRLKYFLKVFDGVEHITDELLNNEYLNDTCKMAHILGRKINCRWGVKRLKEVHDDWSMEIGHITLASQDTYVLKIKPIFREFAEFSGYKLLETNKDMLLEGIKQRHCVGTYIDQVNTGSCAIFHVNGYTLQLVVREFNKRRLTEHANKFMDNKNHTISGIPCKLIERIDYDDNINILVNNQFRGKYNSSPPDNLVDEVDDMLIRFVNEFLVNKVKEGKGFDNSTNSESEILLEVNGDRQHNLLW